ENHISTAPEMSKLWGMTRAAIRFHINNLLQDGLIEKVTEGNQSKRRRGRPMHYYRLVGNAGDSNYQELCSGLLKVLTNLQETDQTFDVIELLANNLLPEQPFSPSLTNKMNMTKNWFNKRG